MIKLLLRVLPIVLLLAASQFTLAQTTTLPSVYGRVLDAQTGEPLRGADISVDFKKSGVSTDSAGRYRLYLPFGEYVLKVGHVGYNPYRTKFYLKAIYKQNGFFTSRNWSGRS
mgnify:CR=1 FL=1